MAKAQDEVRGRLAALLARDDIAPEMRNTLTESIGKLSTPLESDVWIYRIVVIVLGLIVLGSVFGGIYLEVIGKGDQSVSLPEGIVAIGSAAVGALAGLLAPSPKNQ